MKGMTQLNERQRVLEQNMVKLEEKVTQQISHLDDTIHDLTTHVKGKDLKIREIEQGLAACIAKTNSSVDTEGLVK